MDISVLFTGYNEGSELGSNLERVRNLLNTSRYSWEMILYDDRSRDDTPEVFRQFAEKHTNVRAFFHKKNVGRGGTVAEAIKKARGKYIGYIDTDLELSPVYIFEFVKDLENGADMVIATRFYTIGMSNFIRTVMSKGYIFVMHKCLHLPFKDTEAGFKFFKRNKILPILKKVKDKRWFFDTEIVAYSYWFGLKIIETPVVYMRKPEKESSVKVIRDSFDYLKKIWVFRKVAKKYAHRDSHP